jgi:hypothetical protein
MSPDESFIDLMRPAPGIVRCCICFEARKIEDLLLEKATGQYWDICGDGTCAEQAGLNPDGSIRPQPEATNEELATVLDRPLVFDDGDVFQIPPPDDWEQQGETDGSTAAGLSDMDGAGRRNRGPDSDEGPAGPA